MLTPFIAFASEGAQLIRPIRIMCFRLKVNFVPLHMFGLVSVRFPGSPPLRVNRVLKAKPEAPSGNPVIRHALHVAQKVLSSGGHVSFVWPANDEAWNTSERSQFEGFPIVSVLVLRSFER